MLVISYDHSGMPESGVGDRGVIFKDRRRNVLFLAPFILLSAVVFDRGLIVFDRMVYPDPKFLILKTRKRSYFFF